MRRNCCEVIKKMLNEIPKDRIDFIADLRWNYEDASYKPPEETIQWSRVQETLMKHITKPVEDWEFKVISIFTTKTISEIQSEIHEKDK